MSRPEQILFTRLRNEQWDEAKKQLRDDPTVIRRMGWLSISCSGSTGMPIYACIAHLLDPGSELAGGSTKFRHSPEMREVCETVFEVADSMSVEDNNYDKYGLRIQYALRAGWMDIIQECMAHGISVDDMQSMLATVTNVPDAVTEWIQAGGPMTPGSHAEPAPFVDSSDDDTTCCICLDQAPDAIYYPCAHNSFCFTCSRDLKTCPLCREPGYAKPRLVK